MVSGASHITVGPSKKLVPGATAIRMISCRRSRAPGSADRDLV